MSLRLINVDWLCLGGCVGFVEFGGEVWRKDILREIFFKVFGWRFCFKGVGVKVDFGVFDVIEEGVLIVDWSFGFECCEVNCFGIWLDLLVLLEFFRL